MSIDKDLSKPWYRDLSVDLRSWMAFGNEENHPASLDEHFARGSNMKIDAVILIQDCNMCGQYYRYFWYANGEDKRYCMVNSTWCVSDCPVGVDKMNMDVTVRLFDKIFVVKKGTNNDYVKLLLPTESTPIFNVYLMPRLLWSYFQVTFVAVVQFLLSYFGEGGGVGVVSNKHT